MLERIRSRVAKLIAPPSESKGVTLSGFDFYARDMGHVVYFNGTGVGDERGLSRETAYAAAVIASAAIRYRATNVSEPPLRVYDRTDDGWELIEGHQLERVLGAPSDDYDMGETVWLTQASLDLDGKALWVKDADRMARTGRLMPFAGHEYSEEPADGRIYGRYRLRTMGGERKLTPEEVVAWRLLNVYDRYSPVSPTDVALSWLNLGASVKTAVRAMMQNGMFPSAVLSPHHEWHPDDDEYNKLKAEVERYHQGPANTGKPLIALGGMKAERMAFSLKDMLPDEILDRIEATVAMAYGVAPVILGALVGLKNSPWSQMQEARRYTYEDTIVPLWRATERVLTRQLLAPVDATPGRMIRFDTSEVAALQRDQAKDVTTAEQAKHWTIDERRIHTGQEPIGGERGQWIELLDRPEPSLRLTSPEDGDDPEDDPEDEERGYRPSSRDVVWARFDLMAKGTEDDLQAMASEQLRRDARAISAAVETDAFRALWATIVEPPKAEPFDTAAAAVADRLVDSTQSDEEWRVRSQRSVSKAARAAARDVARSHGIAFDLVVPGSLSYARRHSAELVTNIGKTTRERIRIALRDGLEEGDSIPDLAKRIRESTAFSPERATLIARTEATEILNGSQLAGLESYAASDPTQTVEKSWLSARDRDVRKEHQLLDDGQWLAIERTFDNGRTHPGEPNCRCTLVYRIVEAGQ